MANNDREICAEETKYDEGIELPKGFLSWSEVAKSGFSPVSSNDVESLLKALEVN